MAEKIKIAELNFDTDKLDAALVETRKDIDSLTEGIRTQRKTIKDSNKAINEFTQANLKLANSGEKNSKQYKDNQAEIKKLKSAIDNETKALIKNETAQKNLKNEQKEINNVITQVNAKRGQSVDYINKAKNALAQEVTTIKQARDQNKRLNTIRNNVNANTKEGQAALEGLNKRLDKNNKFIDKNADKLTKQKNNIGNYGSALGGVSPVLGALSQKLTAVKEALTVFAVGMKTTEVTTGRTSKALKIFKFALISTGIGAIVVVLGSLISFLATTQAGIDKVTSVTRPLQAIFQSLLGVIQKVGETMFEAFSNPQESIKALWESIKTNIVNRIEGLGDVFKALGKIISSGFTDGYKDLGNATLKVTTGVEDVIGKVTEAGKKTKAFLKEAADKGSEIDRLQKSIEQGEADLILTRAKSRTQLRELQLIANDRTLSAEENNEAAEKALTIANKLADSEKAVINEKIKKEEIQQSLNDSGRKDLTKLNELKAQNLAADEKARATELKFLTAKAGLANEEKKRLADASKAAIENSKKKLEQIVEERELALESFDLQNEGMQGTLKEEIDFYREQSAQKLSILKAQLAAEKLSQEEYDLAVRKLAKETEQEETEAATYYIDQRLAKEREALAQRVEDVKRLSAEEVQARKDAQDKIYNDQLKSLEAQNKAGILSQKEFNAQSDALDLEHKEYKDELDAEYRQQKADDEALRKTLEQEKKLQDEDDAFERKMDKLDFQFDAEQEKLDEQREAGTISEENYLSSLELMTKKHSKTIAEIEQAQQNHKIGLYADAAGAVADILGKETAAGKFFASAQAVMNTFVAASKALTLGPIIGPIMAGLITIKGLATVAKINKTKTQMYTGGYTGDGGEFTRTGYTHAGEVVFNQQDVRTLGGAERVNNMRPTESGFGNMPTGIRNDDNDNDKWEQIGELLKNGVREGSEQGTNTGIVEHSDNIDVKQKAIF